jgi:hypothetical protein
MLVLTIAFPNSFPLTDSGRFFAIADIRASRLVRNSSSLKLRLPILFMINAPSLTLNSTSPYFDCLMTSMSSSGLTKVPLLTLGMRPLGPSTLAYDLSRFIWS